MKDWGSSNATWHRAASYVVAIIAGLIMGANAGAQNLGTAFSDLWWNPAESGWGATVDHQQDVMFVTFFVYRADSTPYWVTATLEKVGTSGLGTSPQVFAGDLYETHGPSFGVPFNPAAVTNRKVGTATFTAPSLVAAALQYSIDGISVTKQIERQTLRFVNYTGQYLGGTVYTSSNCQNPANDDQTVTDVGVLTIIQAGTSFQLTVQGQTLTCAFSGTFSQHGRLGYVNGGNYSCADGAVGTFNMQALEWTIFGMTGLLKGQNQLCEFVGVFGGTTGNHLKP